MSEEARVRQPGAAHDVFDTIDDENLTGPKAVAALGSLKAWCETLQRFGTMSLADVMQPAIKHAARGFPAVPENVRAKLRSMEHDVVAMATVAGGMNAIQFLDDGSLLGAAC